MWLVKKLRGLMGVGVAAFCGAVAAQVPTFTFDELLPHPYSAFTTLRAGASSLANVHDSPRTGINSQPFPTNWAALVPGNSLRLKVLVPPGASMVSWYVQASNLVAGLGACDEAGGNCQERGYPPTLWPVNYNDQAPGAIPVNDLPAVTSPKIVYLTVKPYNITFDFLALYVTYTIKDPALYESWRSQRRWAGGSGDCDGLGGAYAGGVNCEVSSGGGGGNGGTFTLQPVANTVQAGQAYQLKVLPANTVPAACTAQKLPGNVVGPAPQIVTTGPDTVVTGTMPALNAAENSGQLLVECISASGAKGTATINIQPAPGTRTTLTAHADVNLLTKRVKLSAKFTPSEADKGKPVQYWVGAEVKAFGWNVTPILFTKAANGEWLDFSLAKTLDGSNAALSEAAFPETGRSIQVVNDELYEQDLITLSARVYGAYRIGTGPIMTFSQPIYDCSAGTCVRP